MRIPGGHKTTKSTVACETYNPMSFKKHNGFITQLFSVSCQGGGQGGLASATATDKATTICCKK